MTDLLYLDGRYMALAEGKVSVQDRGYLFADGIYEVIRVYGGKPFGLREHLERFERSAREIELELPHSREEFEAICHELIERTGLRECYIYGQVTRGVAPRRHVFVEGLKPVTVFWVHEFTPEPPEVVHAGFKLLSHPDERWARCDIKSISLLPNILAKTRADRAGAYEAILYLPDGTVTEGGATNAFCVIDGTVFTHPLNHRILPGITRGFVVELAHQLGIPLKEEARTLNEFKSAQEVFCTGTTVDVLPVTRIDDTVIGSGRPGPVTMRLRKALLELVAQTCGSAPEP